MELSPSEIFKILSIDTRIKIIELLKKRGPQGAKSIAEEIGITTAAASQHLKILKQAGLVNNERKGYWIPYMLNISELEKCRSILDEVCKCGCSTAQVKEIKHSCNHEHKSTCKQKLIDLEETEKDLLEQIEHIQNKIKEIKEKKG